MANSGSNKGLIGSIISLCFTVVLLAVAYYYATANNFDPEAAGSKAGEIVIKIGNVLMAFAKGLAEWIPAPGML